MTESPDEARLRKLEETLGFCEHTTDQLAQELVRAFEEIRLLNRRIQALESRIEAMGEADSEDESGDPGDGLD